MSVRQALLYLVLGVGCGADLPATPPRGDLTLGDAGSLWASVQLEPDSARDAAPAVVRLRVSGGSDYLPDPADLSLFDGELSAYYLRRLVQGEWPSTLLERLLPSVSWVESDAVTVMAPSRLLSAAQRYSLVSRRLGLLLAFGVGPAPPAVATRRWPPNDAASSATISLYCAPAWPEPIPGEVAALPPSGVAARVSESELSSASERCLRLDLSGPVDPGTLIVPPLALGGLALEPMPLVHRPSSAAPPSACAETELRLGAGCARVLDDRAIVRSAPLRTLWRVAGGAVDLLHDAAPDSSFAILGLTPAGSQELELITLDVAGAETRSQVVLQTLAPMAHVVINEVLADAIGSEPEQEWVELYNDGSTVVDLLGWQLEDAAARVALPSYVLAPGGYVLLVHEGFASGGAGDVPPGVDTPLIVLPSLGGGGLANSGEALALRSADGAVQSRFPRTPKPKPGVSVARRQPATSDDDPSGFAWHAPPGASPGAANQLP